MNWALYWLALYLSAYSVVVGLGVNRYRIVYDRNRQLAVNAIEKPQ